MEPFDPITRLILDLLEIAVIAIVHRRIAQYPMEQGLPVHFGREMLGPEIKRLADQVFTVGLPGWA